MRKRLDTRFPAARIKKIMQTDEDVGKIAMAVPVLVSKALELFLHGLCRRTHEVNLQRGAKTINSVHLYVPIVGLRATNLQRKQCVQNFNEFDFLRETVSRVPDLGSSNGGADDRSAAKRRKTNDNEDHVVDEGSKKSEMNVKRTTMQTIMMRKDDPVNVVGLLVVFLSGSPLGMLIT